MTPLPASARALALLLGLLGCAHRAHIDSNPPGATIKVGSQVLAVTPGDVQVRLVPFRPAVARIDLPGYRYVELDLRADLGPGDRVRDRLGAVVGRPPRSRHDVLLIEVHQGAGTWTPEDVP